MDDLSEPDEAEDSGEGEASGGADPSGGLASSSRSAAPGEDLQVISSGSDEDATHGAPSKCTAEEEEEESNDKGGHREPRTKAAHDKDAGAARGARWRGGRGASSRSQGKPPPAAEVEAEGVEDG